MCKQTLIFYIWVLLNHGWKINVLRVSLGYSVTWKKVYEDLTLGSLYWLRQSVSVFFMPNEHKDVLVPYFCRISEKTVFYETISVKLNRCYLNILRSFIVSTNQDVYACIFFSNLFCKQAKENAWWEWKMSLIE